MAKEPVAKKAAVKKPAVKKSDAKKPVKKAAVKKTDTSKTSVKKPASAKKPAAKKPAVKKTPAKKQAVKITSEWISADKYTENLKIKPLSFSSSGSEFNLTNEELAELYWQQTRYGDLLELCKKVLEQDKTKDSPLWLERQSASCCYLGYWNEAIEVNKKRTVLFPERDAWDILAVVYAVLGDYQSAAAVLRDAEEKMNWDISYNEPDVNKKPSKKAVFNPHGKEGDPNSFSDVSWPKDAMYILYPKILEKAGECAAGWYTLAKFYGDDLRYYDDAVKAIKKVTALKPDWKPGQAYQTQMLSYISKMNKK